MPLRIALLWSAGFILVAAAGWAGAYRLGGVREYRGSTLNRLVPAPVVPEPVTLLFVGDIMLSRGIGSIMAHRDDWLFPFRRTREITSTADLAIGNLEGPISDRGANVGSIYSFRADPRAVDGLHDAGFDILSIANNHIWDYGPDAAGDTVERLRASGIEPVGGGWDRQTAHRPVIRVIRTMRIAFLAYTDLIPLTRDAADVWPTVAFLDRETVLDDVRAARTEADIVVVLLHWGNEYDPHPTAAQRALAESLTAGGATLVIGHHPHVVQDIEYSGDGLIAYSLGNFVFDQNFSPETERGAMLRVVVDKTGILGFEELPIRFTTSFEPYLATATDMSVTR